MILERLELTVLREGTVALAGTVDVDGDDGPPIAGDELVELFRRDTFAVALEVTIGGNRARSIGILPAGSATAVASDDLLEVLANAVRALERLEHGA